MTENLMNRTISVLYRYNQRFFSKALSDSRLPVSVAQIPPLLQVYRNPGITQDKISSDAAIDKGAVARALKQLEISGLVIRKTDQCDRRINHIFVTEKGSEICGQITEIINRLHEILYHGFEDSEVGDAIKFIERMKINIIGYLDG